MKDNPYQAPESKSHPIIPREEWREMIINGQTSAGPLTIWTYKNPKVATAVFGGILVLVGVVVYGLLH